MTTILDRAPAVPDAPVAGPPHDAQPVRGATRRELLVDALVVLALCGLMVWEYTHPRMDDGVRPADVNLAISVPFSILAFAPIAVRRLFPLTAVVVAAGALLLPSLVVDVDVFFWSGFAPMIFLLYSLARHRRLAVAVGAAAGVVLLQAVTSALGGSPEALADVVFLTTFVALGIALGIALRRSAEQRQRLAALLVRVQAEQADRERLAIADQRSGLARDLHDVVAHAVSLMLVQAGAARLSLREDPTLARRFLVGVEQAGREASSDLSALLTVLRADGAVGGEPAPSLGGLPALLERMRRAGLDVHLQIVGTLDDLPGGLDVTAYRIVQESLTNVLKHAGPTRVDVGVVRAEGRLEVTVRDAGPAAPRPPAPASGHGLVGLAERAALFGGTVEAGPRGAGFELRASLPWPDAS